MTEDEDGITLTATGAKVMATETVSTGEYESAKVSATVEMDVEGVDLTEGLTDGLQKRLYALNRSLQEQVKAAGEQRREQAITSQPAGGE